MRTNGIGLRVIAAAMALAVTGIAPSLSTAREDGQEPRDCREFQDGRGYAMFENQVVTVQGPGGPLRVVIPAGLTSPAPGLWASVTGDVTVRIHYYCIEQLEFRVHKHDPLTDTWTQIHHAEWDGLGCGFGTLEEDVHIGLDAGRYRFSLEWVDCFGAAGSHVQDSDELIIDPPLF